ncbi:MAG: alpha-L-arabinofuranosidase C-terminal domain-containing protein [Alloacidobacterium sp.]
MRDALATALTLDCFNRNADKVSLATNAQLINNINALFLAHEDRFVATPNYYVFEMYTSHANGQNLRAEFSSPSVQYMRDGEQAPFWGLNGSASQKGNAVTLTVVNPSLDSSLQTQIVLRGRKVRDASGSVLTASDMHAHNTFDRPDAIKTAPLNAMLSDGSVVVSFPHASVSKIEMTIA